MNQAITTPRSLSSALRRFRAPLAGVTLAVAAATAGMSAWAHGPGGQMEGHRPAMHHHHRAMMMDLGAPSGWGARSERAGHGIDRMLDGLGATEAQRSQIKQIAQAAAADLRTQRDAARALRQKQLEAFTAASVDPAAVEQLRQQQLAQQDQRSRRMTAALLEMSNVLTPEQRVKLGQRLQDRASVMQDRKQRTERAERTQRERREQRLQRPAAPPAQK